MTERQHDQRVLGQFLREASTNLKNVEQALAQLSESPTETEPIAILFRAFHGIKGTSGYAHAKEIGLLSHEAESVLKEIKEGRRPFDAEVVDLMLELHDQLHVLLEALEHGEAPAPDWQELLGKLRGLGAGAVEAGDARSGAPQDGFFDVVSQQLSGLDIYLEKLAPGEPEPRLLKAIARKLNLIHRSTANAGHAKLSAAVSELSGWLAHRTHWQPEEIADFRARLSALEDLLSQHRSGSPSTGSVEAADGPKSEAERDIPIPVRSSRLRRLSNQVEDLVVTHNRLKHILDGLAQQQPEMKNQLRGVRLEMERVVSQLERTAQRAQMIELSVLFDRVPRMVRKISKDMGKQVTLDIHGSDTEIDRSIVDLLGDPLTHVVRNAIDHGIETAAHRISVGKPATGSLNIHAYAMGKHVFIDIQDDGRGIDSQLIRNKAVEKGFVTAEAARLMSDRELLDIVYAPGFSSADTISQVSGRGVGMDAVLQRISEMGGQIKIKTEVGTGTTIRFVLPNSFSLVSCLVVRCGEYLFALPIRFAKETLRFVPGQIVQKGNERWLRQKGRLVRLHHLEDALQGFSPEDHTKRRHAFVMSAGRRELLFDVDELVSMSTLSVRGLPAHLESQHALAGVTTVGAGNVAFFLHALAIVERLAGRRHAASQENL